MASIVNDYRAWMASPEAQAGAQYMGQGNWRNPTVQLASDRRPAQPRQPALRNYSTTEDITRRDGTYRPNSQDVPMMGDGGGASALVDGNEEEAAYNRFSRWVQQRFGQSAERSGNMSIERLLSAAYRENPRDPQMVKDIHTLAAGYGVPPPWAGTQDSGGP